MLTFKVMLTKSFLFFLTYINKNIKQFISCVHKNIFMYVFYIKMFIAMWRQAQPREIIVKPQLYTVI